MSALALEMQKVSKRFDATQALMAGIHPPDERARAEVVA
jgi:hypothetical protein